MGIMPTINYEQIQNIIREIAAEEIMPRFRNLNAEDINEKSSPTDLVTAADILTEKRLTPILQDLIQGSIVIGEEGVAENPALINTLNDRDIFWIIDPVDGTRNFVAGTDQFCTMLALVQGGETTHAWIYHPPTDKFVMAEKGAGTQFDKVTIDKNPETPFEFARLDYNPKYMEQDHYAQLQPNFTDTQRSRIGHCSGWAYMDCARGKLDGILHGFLKPWDHVAGNLILAEAGGYSGFLDSGEPYLPKQYPNRPMLSVANKDMFEQYKAAFTKS